MEDICTFHGAIDNPVFDFWWRLPWVSKPGWIPFACFLACVILRFTSSVTPTECIQVSMAAKPFWSTYLQTCPQALVEVRGSNPPTNSLITLLDYIDAISKTVRAFSVPVWLLEHTERFFLSSIRKMRPSTLISVSLKQLGAGPR